MGTTPTYSWPYPDDTDPVANGAQDIEDLALAIETTVSGLKIAQVVSTTKTDAFSTSGGGASITGLTATITPTSATSKIFVSYTITVSHDTPATAGPFGNLRRQVSGLSGVNIYQGSFGSVADRSNFVRYFFGSNQNTYNFTGEILDTPATTSAITYDYVIGTVGTGTTHVNRPANSAAYGLASTITAMEVLA